MRVRKFFAPDDGTGSGDAGAEPAALTVDTAVAAMRENREKAQDTQEKQPTERKPEARVEKTATVSEPEEAEESEEAPDNEGETEDEKLAKQISEGQTTDPGELPSGWSKANDADLALWNALTPEAQDKLRMREKQRDEGIKTALQKSHVEAKQAAEEREALKAERQKIAPILESQRNAILQQMVREFPGVDPRDPNTLMRLALEHPEKKVAFDALWNQLGQVSAAEKRFEAEQKKRADEEHNKFSEARVARLHELDESLKDPTKAQSFETEVLEFLIKGNPYGPISEDLIKGATAEMLLLARDAMKYRKALASLKVPPKKEVPKVMRPGASRDGGKTEEVAALEKRLRKSGKIDDAVAAMRARRTG